MRSIGIGMIMGGTTSGLQTVQAKIGNMRDATATTQESSPPTTAIGDAASVGMALPPKTKEELPVYAGEAADVELPQPVAKESSRGWSSFLSWIPGMGGAR
jgi:hypothetical protein